MAGAPAGCVRYRRLARFTPKPSAGCALCTLAGGSPRWQARSGVAASRPACGGADDSPDPTRLSIALVPKPWARVEPRSSQGRARVGPGSGQGGRARVVGPNRAKVSMVWPWVQVGFENRSKLRQARVGRRDVQATRLLDRSGCLFPAAEAKPTSAWPKLRPCGD